MNPILIVLIFSFGLITSAQPSSKLDTLYANESHITALFFPSPIRQAVTGSENFSFSYNDETAQYFGALQGSPGTKSNLLVITYDGKAYSYRLEYRKHLTTTHRFVQSKESIGNENPELDTMTVAVKVNNKVNMDSSKIVGPNHYRNLHFKSFSAYLVEQAYSPLKSKRKDGLVIRLLDLVYDRSEVYAIIEIENNSEIDFELDYLKIFKVNGNKKRKSSYQKLEMLPVFKYGFPKMVRVMESKQFVVVLPKFTLGDSEKLLLELNELHGGRFLELRSK
ncbi:MAG TPA: DUF4138 domain-containing protein [Flavobacteriaceae bacterium]